MNKCGGLGHDHNQLWWYQSSSARLVQQLQFLALWLNNSSAGAVTGKTVQLLLCFQVQIPAAEFVFEISIYTMQAS